MLLVSSDDFANWRPNPKSAATSPTKKRREAAVPDIRDIFGNPMSTTHHFAAQCSRILIMSTAGFLVHHLQELTRHHRLLLEVFLILLASSGTLHYRTQRASRPAQRVAA